MEIRKIVASMFGKRYGSCQFCKRKAELERVKVSNYFGKPSYKYLCRRCAALENFKRY